MEWRWVADWMWGLPLLILTVVFHVSIFVLMVRLLLSTSQAQKKKTRRRRHFIADIAMIALGAAALHSFEAILWAAVYLWLGALSDGVSAMLYSLSAITSYGHANVFLADRWKLLGAIEAMNGLILFGLTTAFLFSAIEQVAPSKSG